MLSSFYSRTNTLRAFIFFPLYVFAKEKCFPITYIACFFSVRLVDQSRVYVKLVVFNFSFVDPREGEVGVTALTYLKGFVKGNWEK